ncbi:MAG: hypothetical protein M3017_16515 [Actinomycetota bacterium]|nr:hypothetical protein [Actinomycetota bacterium]
MDSIVEQGSAAAAEEELEQLIRGLDALRSSMRRSGATLPTVLSSQLRQIDDVLRPLVNYVAAHGASTEQKVLLGAVITDYIPSPLRAYLAVDASEHADGSKSTKLFAEQLKVLEATVKDLDAQVRSGAVSELSVHARFLADKFGPSLRLEGS